MDFAVVVGLHGRRLHEQLAFLNLQNSAKQVKYAHRFAVVHPCAMSPLAATSAAAYFAGTLSEGVKESHCDCERNG
jgi:hypothetical protein